MLDTLITRVPSNVGFRTRSEPLFYSEGSSSRDQFLGVRFLELWYGTLDHVPFRILQPLGSLNLPRQFPARTLR